MDATWADRQEEALFASSALLCPGCLIGVATSWRCMPLDFLLLQAVCRPEPEAPQRLSQLHLKGELGQSLP